MNKLLIICGPTATGKTNLGISLAKQLNGEIISADSRQVYQGMGIGTGKSLPQNSQPRLSQLHVYGRQLYNYHFFGTTIWGYDLVKPTQEFSVGQYTKLAQAIAKDIWNRHKLPILVGGTGLYLKALTQPLETITIPPNQKLRHQAESFNTTQLQAMLSDFDPDKLKSMNQSDQNNPRRLIRAIEIAQFRQLNPHPPQPPITTQANALWIGLKTNLKQLDKRIAQNVKSRTTAAMSSEVKQLESIGIDWDSPAASATGYSQWKQYLEGKITKAKAIKLWTTAETQYARRQLTWFSKQSQINWFDISKPDWQPQVEARVKAWYSKHSN